MVDYRIVSTGSKGNAVILNSIVLIDCGVPYKAIAEYVNDIKLVLLTHIHGDHFKPSTIRKLGFERPSIRFACGSWLVPHLVQAGIKPTQIDVVKPGLFHMYGPVSICPVQLVHDVPNIGYKLHFDTGKVFYATDTYNLNGISAKNYDLYMVEANYENMEMQQRIDDQQAVGEYAYEIRARRNHLSKEKCNDWLYANMGYNSEYVYIHQHED